MGSCPPAHSESCVPPRTPASAHCWNIVSPMTRTPGATCRPSYSTCRAEPRPPGLPSLAPAPLGAVATLWHRCHRHMLLIEPGCREAPAQPTSGPEPEPQPRGSRRTGCRLPQLSRAEVCSLPAREPGAPAGREGRSPCLLWSRGRLLLSATSIDACPAVSPAQPLPGTAVTTPPITK